MHRGGFGRGGSMVLHDTPCRSMCEPGLAQAPPYTPRISTGERLRVSCAPWSCCRSASRQPTKLRRRFIISCVGLLAVALVWSQTSGNPEQGVASSGSVLATVTVTSLVPFASLVVHPQLRSGWSSGLVFVLGIMWLLGYVGVYLLLGRALFLLFGWCQHFSSRVFK
ncbi:hypothetical protein BGZ61DRAFT_197351 [Ilyonectria robusta]|uniref:uncharacterized protein n=1 Tax=Ilyonectria robusta TaxID=1079257 RepID=UPI001E8ED771|nr:uncharacterized protein BGZ61DRAFT_197351 [Ilyonectria robusta]KAH8721957.1 hypothetical protein BGZ61DRAFT_197351 [Ilyonectria robusta]